jgi:4-nitrophenyl phosphatase
MTLSPMTDTKIERLEELQALRGLVVDMDGVLWRGDHPMAGLQDFFATLRKRGIRFVLATNNNTRKPAGFVEKLAQFGVGISENEVITASVVTVEYLKGKYPPGTPIHLLAEQPFKDLVSEEGYPLVDSNPAAVVVSMDRQLTYEKLRVASLLIRQGAEFIGANPDVAYPTPQGLAPGSGTLIAAVAACSEQEPVIMGKPEPWIFRIALKRMGLTAGCTASLGDRLSTDIQGALRIGMRTILVLSGVTTPEGLDSSGIRPDWVFANIAELAKVWKTD